MRAFISVLVGGFVLGGVTAVWAADANAGKEKSAPCAACHGADGIGVAPIYPNLAGQKEEHIVSALKAYQSEERKGGNAMMMTPMAKSLSDEDIANLAAFYAGLKPM